MTEPEYPKPKVTIPPGATNQIGVTYTKGPNSLTLIFPSGSLKCPNEPLPWFSTTNRYWGGGDLTIFLENATPENLLESIRKATQPPGKPPETSVLAQIYLLLAEEAELSRGISPQIEQAMILLSENIDPQEWESIQSKLAG